jgi:hypothetical protein
MTTTKEPTAEELVAAYKAVKAHILAAGKAGDNMAIMRLSDEQYAGLLIVTNGTNHAVAFWANVPARKKLHQQWPRVTALLAYACPEYDASIGQ